MELIAKNRERDRRRGLGLAIILHIVLIIFLFLPLLHYTYPPPGQAGILVAFGEPEVGSNEPQQSPSQPVIAPPVESKPETEPVKQEIEKAATPQKEEIVRSEKEELVIPKPDPEALKRKEAELEAKRKQDEAKRKAEEEARRKAEEEARKQKEFEETKNAYSELLKKGGSGNQEKTGQQGNPDGSPDATNLKGLTKGSGMIGGGLGDRGVRYEPDIKDNSQKTGKVVIKVCVNSKGDVISAEYTQRGSTTTDGELRQLALDGAKRYKFAEGKLEKQCGTITFDFRLK